MQFISNMIPLVERVSIPDPVARLAIRQLVSHTSRSLARQSRWQFRRFAHAMADMPIATHTREANAQHYELPPEFFGLVLGPQRKYSCCFYESDVELACGSRGCRARSHGGACRLVRWTSHTRAGLRMGFFYPLCGATLPQRKYRGGLEFQRAAALY